VRCRTYANTKEKGDALEARVVRWLRRRGEGGIRRNVVLTDAHGNRSEIDVMCGRVFKTYIECKNYSKPVPLKDVAKFKEASAPPPPRRGLTVVVVTRPSRCCCLCGRQVLQLNNLPIHRGLFITTNTFAPRAEKIGIRCVDGAAFRRLERAAQGRRVLRWVIAGAGAAGWLLWNFDAVIEELGVEDAVRDAIGAGSVGQLRAWGAELRAGCAAAMAEAQHWRRRAAGGT
jgi:hypothetical protein